MKIEKNENKEQFLEEEEEEEEEEEKDEEEMGTRTRNLNEQNRKESGNWIGRRK